MDETQAMIPTSVNPGPGIDETPTPQRSFEEQLQVMEAADEGSPIIRTLTRLLVGGTLIGREELLKRLQRWEQDARTNPTATTQEPASQLRNQPGTIVIDPAVAARTTLPITPPQNFQYRSVQQYGSVQQYRSVQQYGSIRQYGPIQSELVEPELSHVLLGLLFEAESRMGKRGKRFRKFVGQTTNAFFSPLLNRLEKAPMLEPARSRFDQLVTRGQAETQRWAERGRIEEAHSRRLATTAAQETFTSSMDQLGQAPALQDLVRRQSAGITRDVLDEARERTVSGDMLAEHLARRLFRRIPRYKLPRSTVTSTSDLPDQSQPTDRQS